MGILTEFELENRKALVDRVYSFLELAKITPFQLRDLKKVLEPRKDSVIVGPEIVEVLCRKDFLIPIESLKGDLHETGWFHKVIIKEVDYYHWRRALPEREHRITGYYVREKGKIACSTGGELILKVRGENGARNYWEWRLRWASDNSTLPMLPGRDVISSEAYILHKVFPVRIPDLTPENIVL